MAEVQAHDMTNNIVATGSGLVGGTVAMIKTGLLGLVTIDTSRIVDVGIYSLVSASAGYIIKLTIDYIIEKVKQWRHNIKGR